jgi:hypothetical protein
VAIRAKDSAGNDIPVQPWGPHVIAPGAIIDLVFEA